MWTSSRVGFSPASTAPLLSPELLSGGCDLDETLEYFLKSKNKKTDQLESKTLRKQTEYEGV